MATAKTKSNSYRFPDSKPLKQLNPPHGNHLENGKPIPKRFWVKTGKVTAGRRFYLFDVVNAGLHKMYIVFVVAFQ